MRAFINVLLTAAVMFFAVSELYSQNLNVNINVKPQQKGGMISPYIYGANFHTYPGYTARRLGGNRMTGYNWENNFSNAGDDWEHSSDEYLPYILGVPEEDYNKPASVITHFADECIDLNAYSLIYLQMAGYVAKDGNGTVSESQTAPSSRWAEVKNIKNAPFSLSPDLTDNYVYMDELLNFLVTKYGRADQGGINAYALDNEPALWPYTHPRMHPEVLTVNELLEKSIDLASVIKSLDPSAEVFGPSLYGFNAYWNLQEAPDWSNYSDNYKWFIDVYLDAMKQASTTEGKRLLDVLNIHWYPEPDGVSSSSTTREVVQRRVQAVRSLWDSTYVEDSWIGEWFSPVAILRQVQSSINEYYPNTKLGVTEYDYGGIEHISGAVAQADALGVFGKYGVYFASRWDEIDSYNQKAFEIFRNYDGLGSQFPDRSVFSETADIENTSVYSAENADGSKLHLVLINKNLDNPVNMQIEIDDPAAYTNAEVWGLTSSGPQINYVNEITLSGNNSFDIIMPALSVYHTVINKNSTSAETNKEIQGYSLSQNYPNPFNPETTIEYSIPRESPVTIKVYDLLGQEVTTLVNQYMNPGIHKVKFDASSAGLSGGIYLYKIKAGEFTSVRKLVLLK